MLSKRMLLSRLIDVARTSLSDFANSLSMSTADGTREACFKTSVTFDSETGMSLFLVDPWLRVVYSSVWVIGAFVGQEVKGSRVAQKCSNTQKSSTIQELTSKQSDDDILLKHIFLRWLICAVFWRRLKSLFVKSQVELELQIVNKAAVVNCEPCRLCLTSAS